MSEFRDVTVVREANVYFGGSVTSRAVLFPDGSKKTLGIMQLGEYEFNTDAAEVMEILAGDLDVLLPGAKGWTTVGKGQQFRVPANSTLQLRVRALTDYCCTYLP